MKQGFCYIAAIVDRSSSMSGVTKETIQGFNDFLKEQRAQPGTAMMTLCTFADGHQFVYDGVPLANVVDLNQHSYIPRGNTALNDAAMVTIDAVGARLAAMPESERPSQVVVLVITDGEENRSKTYPGDAGKAVVAAKIRHQREVYKWQFVFIGANIDAAQVAQEYGMRRQDAQNFVADSGGTSSMLRGLSANVAHYRSAGHQVSPQGFFAQPVPPIPDPNDMQGKVSIDNK